MIETVLFMADKIGAFKSSWDCCNKLADLLGRTAVYHYYRQNTLGEERKWPTLVSSALEINGITIDLNEWRCHYPLSS